MYFTSTVGRGKVIPRLYCKFPSIHDWPRVQDFQLEMERNGVCCSSTWLRHPLRELEYRRCDECGHPHCWKRWLRHENIRYIFSTWTVSRSCRLMVEHKQVRPLNQMTQLCIKTLLRGIQMWSFLDIACIYSSEIIPNTGQALASIALYEVYRHTHQFTAKSMYHWQWRK